MGKSEEVGSIVQHLTSGQQRKIPALLRVCPLFAAFTDEELSRLLPKLRLEILTFPQGETVISINDVVDRLFLVVFGRLAEQRALAGAAPHCFGYHKAGDLFGLETYFSTPKRSPVEVVAVENSSVLSFLPDVLESKRYFPRFSRASNQILANRAVEATLCIDVLRGTSLREKIMTYFSAMKDKFCSDMFQVPMSYKEMAEYFNVNRSALSRELHRMEREGIIKLKPERRVEVMTWQFYPSKPEEKAKAALSLTGEKGVQPHQL